MITTILVNTAITIVNFLFAWWPNAEQLPTIFGLDLDETFTTAITTYNTFAEVIWPIHYVMLAFLFLMGYFVIKITFKLILGGRSPVHN